MSKMYDLLKAAEARRLVTVEREAKERQLQAVELGTSRISAEAIVAPARSAEVRATERVTFIKSSFHGLDRTYRSYLAMILPVIVAGFLVIPGPKLFEKNPSEAPLGDNVARVSVTAISQVSTVRVTDDQASTAVKEQQRVEPEIRQMVMQWADAWSRRDAAAYLSFYAVDFNLPHGVHRADWEALRQLRLRKNHSIEVILKNIKISYTGSDAASVRFAQDFWTDNYKETGTPKELRLKKSQGRWFIVRERSL